MTFRTMPANQSVSEPQSWPVTRNSGGQRAVSVSHLREHFKRAGYDDMLCTKARSERSSCVDWRAHRRRSDAFSCLLTEVKLLFTTRLRKLKVRLGIFSTSRTYTIVLGVCQCSSNSGIDFQEVIASGEGQGTDVKSDGARKEAKELLYTHRCNHT